MPIPFTRPNPPKLSEASGRLREIEQSGMFSNYGPVSRRFEDDMTAGMFDGQGSCLTVCNATIGLMLAVRQSVWARPQRARYALMPSFTFAAAAHAAIWCGLTPLFCDIDPDTWAASANEEQRLISMFGDEIAVVMPYATFGFDIDLSWYERIMAEYRIPVVVDAAASLGTKSAGGKGFGTGFSGAVVFSMHATKSFATGEAGLIYSGNDALISEMRTMGNFGFGAPRTATMPGLNSKLSEVGALLGSLCLEGYEAVMQRRVSLAERYRAELPNLHFQPLRPERQAYQFVPALLPPDVDRVSFVAALAARGIGVGTYFSPHLQQQEYFARQAIGGKLPVTDDVAVRVVSLPLFDSMTDEELGKVVEAVNAELCWLTAAPIQIAAE